jgi:bifunctional DNA-binding transcriptional regulator/antitoxin component of YhaV-PrlF toxin-antitoxin module
VATVTISTKHQLTLPIDMVRDLGLEPGQKYVIANEEGRIVIYPDKHSRTEYFAGSLGGLYGKTREDVDAYLAEVRGDWGIADEEAPFERP